MALLSLRSNVRGYIYTVRIGRDSDGGFAMGAATAEDLPIAKEEDTQVDFHIYAGSCKDLWEIQPPGKWRKSGRD